MNCPPQFTADAVALYKSRPEARIRQVAEPPTPGRVARLVGSAVTTFHERFCEATVDRLSAVTRSRLDNLVAEDGGVEDSAGGGVTFFSELKAEPGALRLDSLLTEVNKLQRVRARELAPKLFSVKFNVLNLRAMTWGHGAQRCVFALRRRLRSAVVSVSARRGRSPSPPALTYCPVVQPGPPQHRVGYPRTYPIPLGIGQLMSTYRNAMIHKARSLASIHFGG